MAERCVKVVLLGEPAAGKSALAERYSVDTFTPLSLPTIGIDFFRIRRPAFKVHLWDTAGQERFRSIVTSYYRLGEALVLVVDGTADSHQLPYWYEQCCEHNPEAVFMVFGTKADLLSTKTPCGQAWCEERGIPYLLTSASTGEGVEEAFAEAVRRCGARPPPEFTLVTINKKRCGRCCG
jgi:small GTP-binding protein